MATLTVFGVRSDANAESIDSFLTTLYGVRVLSDKEKKKLEKMQKFNAKKKAQEETDAKPKAAKAEKEKVVKTKDKPQEQYTFVPTPAGEKKNTTGGMAPAYNPLEVEDGWYAWWVKQGFFKPEYQEEHPLPCATPETPNFTIVIPPPNVTGSLHLGHALTNAIEDALTRWHRMSGRRALWNPGCDHAGIATQMVVEKKLAREKKPSRHEMGREAFLAEVWKWKDQNGARIYEQLKGLGASLDWDREAFTMSPRCCKAVAEAFIRLHEEGLIYRADRLINWSCRLNSSISDIEVEKRELTGRTPLSVPGYDEKIEFGLLTSFAYKIDGSNEEIVVATTRPETMLGDVAVAVHPNDARYTHLVGKTITHPFINRKLVIVADTMVDIAFGTGAVKITPAHDQNDYECGQRHSLPMITIFTKSGLVTDDCGKFSGMKRFHARAAVVAELKALGLYRGEAENAMVVPICSRSGDVIEPLRVPQWFCNCDAMAKASVDAVRSGALKLIPAIHEKTWFNWLENIRDWCISRQLWWGHRIPAYFITVDDAAVPKGDEVDNKYWVSAHTEEEARAKAAARFGVPAAKIKLHQDEDVLDTWFSSGLFPISIFGWPDDTSDLRKFYPGQLLETGHDILFFWVARMVMMCTKLTGKLPFTEVFLHSIVRDAHGRKMSKSLGNVIDPMDVRNGITLQLLQERLAQGNLDPREIEKAQAGQAQDFPNGIPECGVDALRFALCAFSSQGRDINLDVQRIFGYRTFCNKIFNAVKFSIMQIGQYTPPAAFALGAQSDVDKWILHRLSGCIAAVTAAFQAYDFPAATSAAHSFWLYDFCDVYLELSKPVFKEGSEAAIEAAKHTLYTCCDLALRLLSPFMPFLTEELWQRLPRRAGDTTPSICVSSFPTPVFQDAQIDADFNTAYDLVKAARSLRSDRIDPKARPEMYIRASPQTLAIANRFSGAIITLARASKLTVIAAGEAVPSGCALAPCGDSEVLISLKGLFQNLDAELARQADKRAQLVAAADKLAALAASADYQAKVPEAVRAKTASQLDELRSQIAALDAAVKELSASQA
eukprot:m.229126 g.229126  ORF g.229126 m.229126 type:complete len:1061 (-) comp11860_c0_seq1:43-3225(-)